ncbi:MAG: NAD(+)/NADH kinase [Nitrospinae bacterium]|nr:NAD(+)/NADH kinase [Nitrospinota bacterium]
MLIERPACQSPPDRRRSAGGKGTCKGERVNKIGIIAKPRPDAKPVLEELIQWLEARGIEPVMDVDTASMVGATSTHMKNAVPSAADLIVVLGGDGTLLSVARLVEGKDVPILGVNLGSLGFLTEVTIAELFPTLTQVLDGQYSVSERVMLNCHVHRQGERIAQAVVLNDVVINKGALARIIEMETYVDGVLVNTFRADGLIIATPTGSTAYSLAAGGPILYPSLQTLIINPICPFTLTNRPLVIPDTVKIEVILVKENEDVLVTLDGQVGVALRYRDVVEIRKAETRLKLIQCPGKNYFEILRTKLKWGDTP